MIDAIQAREISKTNFKALESDLELHSEYFKHISDAIENAVRQSQKSTTIVYKADKRFTDILTVLKWKGYKVKHYRCMNICTTYYQDPVYEELQYEPSYEVIKDTGLEFAGNFIIEW
jgi:hypothetical protein